MTTNPNADSTRHQLSRHAYHAFTVTPFNSHDALIPVQMRAGLSWDLPQNFVNISYGPLC